MEDEIEIVRAVEKDLPDISEAAAAIWRTVYPAIITEEQIEYMLRMMYEVDVLQRDMAAGVRYERIVAPGGMIGFAAWGPTPEAGVCKLHKLYLYSVWQGRGIGSHTLRHVMEEAKRAGMTRMTLNVNKNNFLAIAAYERNGFEIVESVCDDIGAGFVMDDYVMARAIT
jgi:ribosomal protein S18 acetylase RimI-like enzyme